MRNSFVSKEIAGAILLAALTGSFTLAAAGPGGAPAPTVGVITAEMVEATAIRSTPGRIEAIEEVALSPRISGNIVSCKFKEGDMVEAGQLLFELEDTSYRAQVMAARAKLDQNKAELVYAKINFDRQATLTEQNAVSKSTYDDANRLYNLSKAKVAESEATLLEAENNFSYTKIYSPIKGRVGKALLSVGNYVTPATGSLVTVVQTHPVYAVFALSERDFNAMFQGSIDEIRKSGRIRVRLADGKLYAKEGKVALVSNKVDSATSTIKVWASFENDDERLIPGGLVTVLTSKATAEKFPAVPLSAILTDGEATYIYVVDKEGTVGRRDVKFGPIVGNRQLVSEGLKEGESVIVEGTHKAIPTQKVNAIPAKQ